MKDSKAVVIAIIALILAFIAIVLAVAKFSSTGEAVIGGGWGTYCWWQTATFTQIGDDVIVGDSCTYSGSENFDPFAAGSITTTNGVFSDRCADTSYLNEFWCDGTVGKQTYGYCSGGCNFAGLKTTTDATTPKDVCFSKVRVCSTGDSPPAAT